MPPNEPQRDLSPERKATFYVGNAIAGVGLLLFLSTFVTFALNFGSHDDDTPRRMGMAFLRAVIGFVMIAVGQVIARAGSHGLAGAGLIPDPKRQRSDLEPWNRSKGGMVNDALSEIDMLKPSSPATPVVKVRCPQCKALNDETDKFCGQCGGKLV